MSNERAQFVTRIGAIAATVGSAVGLGNIWRFPYEAGKNGGGAFFAHLYWVRAAGGHPGSGIGIYYWAWHSQKCGGCA